jgi:DNA (cytosine-5)-methyltransferase 1
VGGKEVKHLSLFTGIGGIDLAAEWAGFESVCMVERDKYCQKVLAKNFEGVRIHDDVTTFNGLEYRGAIDLVSAGFPCQPHSLAGLRKASGDERDLWGEVVRILRETQPQWFLGENVPGLFTSESGQFFGRIINDLESLGFSVGWGCYGAKDVGAVHKRDRVFIVAYANSKRCQEQWEPEQLETQQLAIEHNSIVAYASGKSRLQTNTTVDSIREERDSRDNVMRRDWQPIRGGDWREWGIRAAIPQSRICGDNDGVSYRVDKHRTQRLKALGNAVVPQQVFPILQEIARQIRENGGATP